MGRHAHEHVDLADGHARLRNDPTATMHILEIERIAPQILHVNIQIRRVVDTMLRRARGSTFPVLRGIAERAGIAT